MFYHPYSYPLISDQNYLVTGIFESGLDLATLLAELELHGYQEKDISIVMSDATRDRSYKIEKKSKAAETAGEMGGLTGLAGALVFGLGSAAATGVTSGLGVVMAGPLISTLAGFGGGAAVGGLLGALAGADMPDYELEFTRKHIENGHILLAVKVPDKEKADQVRKTFKDHNVIDEDEELEHADLAYGGSNAL